MIVLDPKYHKVSPDITISPDASNFIETTESPISFRTTTINADTDINKVIAANITTFNTTRPLANSTDDLFIDSSYDAFAGTLTEPIEPTI